MPHLFKEPGTPREQALFLLAACDNVDAGDYEKHVVVLARRWLRMIGSPRTTQESVDRLLDAFIDPAPSHYGMYWERLEREILRWADGMGWLEPGDPRLARLTAN